MPKTTVFAGAVVDGAKKALTPAAHASATISRAILSSLFACAGDIGKPGTWDPLLSGRVLFGQDRVLYPENELSQPRVGFAGKLKFPRPLRPPSLQNDSTLLSAPHLSAWSDRRRLDCSGEAGAQCRLFASAAARASIRAV